MRNPDTASILAFCAMLWLLVALAWLQSLRFERDDAVFRRKVARFRVWLYFALGEMALFALGSAMLAAAALAVLAILGVAEVCRVARAVVPVIAGVVAAALFSFLLPASQVPWLLAGIAAAVFGLPYSARVAGRAAAAFLAGAYVALPAAAVYLARDVPAVLAVVLLTLTASHLVDIGSGVVGKVGKIRPLKVLSPNKTIAGFAAGAAIAGVAVAAMYGWFCGSLVGLHVLTGAAVVWAVTSVGDLVGSKIKRVFGVKDFSDVLGPHGGFMDRLDAIAPITVVGALWFAPGLFGGLS